MTQITEDYVSFETAKLLKDKGFDAVCRTAYETITNEHEVEQCSLSSWGELNQVKRPTLQMAMKWLREVHHYYIQVMFDSWASGRRLGYFVVIHKTDSDFEMMLHYAVDEAFYKTYEEACEAAIKYCLENLI